MGTTALLFLVWATSKTLGLKLSVQRWDAADEEYFKQKQCNPVELELFRADSAARPGLIIAGHGGSSTRAFQKMVDLAGTHYFGALDHETRDSLVPRWSKAIDDHSSVMSRTGRVDYEFADVDEGLRSQVYDNICRCMLILDDMQQQDPLRPWLPRPWALKEPWLRFMLPFVDQVVGPAGYKFVHVTRDIRNIHQTATEKEVFPLSAQPEQFQALADEANKYNMQLAEDLQLMSMPKGLQAVQERFNSSLNVSPEEVKNLAMVAHAWAVTELALKESWEARRPNQYFHISGKKMDEPDKALLTAQQLAVFLGVKQPSEETVRSMASAYTPTNHAPQHWQMMNMIVNLDGMERSRQALRAFDYNVGLRPD